jgi:hypothetical protein
MRISDPWELGEALKWETFDAEIISVIGDNILIRLLKPFIYKETRCEFFVASPWHEGDHVEALRNNKTLFCGMTRITPEQANSDNPFDLSCWREGIAIIGNIDLAEPDE